MKYGYKEIRKVSLYNLSQLCCEQEWFTNGTTKEYERLLRYSEKENITTDDIVEMAERIIEHSDLHPDMQFTDVMFAIGDICTTHFEEC